MSKPRSALNEPEMRRLPSDIGCWIVIGALFCATSLIVWVPMFMSWHL